MNATAVFFLSCALLAAINSVVGGWDNIDRDHGLENIVQFAMGFVLNFGTVFAILAIPSLIARRWRGGAGVYLAVLLLIGEVLIFPALVVIGYGFNEWLGSGDPLRFGIYILEGLIVIWLVRISGKSY